MTVDLTKWTGTLQLQEVEEKPLHPLTVKYGSVEIDKLGKELTPTQVSQLAYWCFVYSQAIKATKSIASRLLLVTSKAHFEHHSNEHCFATWFDII